ncbi:hypothetical protein [Geobacillus phage GR1]|nr:hypothetical protein [Geobacillus phage GR1]
MGMKKWISRKEEQEIPEFKSHNEARKYFKDKYGDNFQMSDSEIIDGMKVFFYYLIIDEKAFSEGQKLLREGKPVSGLEFIGSHQPIQIYENGTIHIVH